MIITITKRRGGLAAVLAGLALAPAARADLQFTPKVDVRETWTDNVLLSNDAQARSQLVSEVIPGFDVNEHNSHLQLQGSYQLHAYHYASADLNGVDSVNHELALNGKARLIGEELFLDFRAGVSQQPVSAFGPVSPDAGYVATNRNEVRSYTFSPYLVQKLGSLAVGQLRYTHDLVSSDNAGFGNSNSDALLLTLSNGPMLRAWGWDVTLNHQTLNDHVAPTSNTDAANLAAHYALTNTFSLLENVGYDKFDYETGPGQPTGGKSWSTGFKWQPSARTSLEATVGRRYYGPSYDLVAQQRTRHTVWNLSYHDDVTTSRAQFLLPSALDTANLLDSMLLSQIPDPVQRAAAVAAYIRANGLPSSLPDSINYFSNRYILQKQALASVALTGARTTGLLSLYRTRRQALSSVQEDSQLLGSGISTDLNDNTNQSGVSAILSATLNPRTSMSLSASYSKTESLTLTKDTQINHALRWMVTHQFLSRLSGVLELRQSRNRSTLASGAGTSGTYTEHAVAASLSMKF
ncbi:TIGR03016 family PEP-CTERM system-associated outer membrane protein [Rugamonas sp.]|uniref:TIGR03016 family PEP-CTERM system-associated outer membrane protein n=1 Tax=Rugamonas sp. TaxID=1926287 RepID=UPI0025F87685|nr:TIGR03016 family PEP-CTERM system-associated outer membrane protein [Rugamonas sp.]